MLALLKTILLCGLVAAVPVDPNLEASQKLTALQSTQTGKFLVSLAALHSALNGPLDDLKETIQKYGDNLQDSLKKLEGEYSTKTAMFDKTLQSIELNIQNAQIDIAQSQDMVDNNLNDQKDVTNRRISQIKQNIEDNRKNLSRDKYERDMQNKQNIDHIHEHSLATTSIDEALQLVQGLQSGNIAFSEAPLRKTVDFIKTRLDSRDEYAPMIQALVDLSGTQDTKAIRDLLNKLRNSLVDSQIQLTKTENDAQTMFDNRQKQLEAEFREFQTQINQATYDLTSLLARIDQETQFITARKNDLAMYLEQQQMEKDAQADQTGLYQEYRALKLKEIKILDDANNFVSSASFRSLLQQKINK